MNLSHASFITAMEEQEHFSRRSMVSVWSVERRDTYYIIMSCNIIRGSGEMFRLYSIDMSVFKNFHLSRVF